MLQYSLCDNENTTMEPSFQTSKWKYLVLLAGLIEIYWSFQGIFDFRDLNRRRQQLRGTHKDY